MPEPTGPTGVPIKSVKTLFEIVQTLQERDGAGVTSVADELGIAKSTAHNHLSTLERLGYVVRRGDEYRIGFRFLDHGGFALVRSPWHPAVKARVTEIANETRELCQFAIEEHGLGVITIREEGAHAIRTELRVGSRLYLNHFTAGKTIMAAMPERRVDAIIDRHGLPPKTSETITDAGELRAELAVIRERGYAFDQEQHVRGLSAIGVPMVLDEGRVHGALSIAGPSYRIGTEQARAMANTLLGVANELELNLSLRS